MGMLYYDALAHQDSFAVRWIKSKSMAELLFAPLSQRLRDEYRLEVLGSTLAQLVNTIQCDLCDGCAGHQWYC